MSKLVVFISFYLLLCCDALKLHAVEKLSDLDIADPDAKRNASELIRDKGYNVEEHTVATEDGYLLSLLRIPHGRTANTERNNKGVVLLVHGDAGDSGQWVLNFANQSLGFILPDNGYDTWLISNRGSRYSKKHIHYKTNEYRFWNFSMDELGQYDLPATVDYILDATCEDGLYIVGHSRGGAQTFIMLSENPDYNKKVKLFIAMAPATFLWHITSPVRALVPAAEESAAVINLVTNGEFTPENAVIRRIRSDFCTAGAELCAFFLFAISGIDRAQLNETRMGVYTSHFPSGTSTRSILQYTQEEPPDYDLASIEAPVALFWSENDKLVDPRDIDILRKSLNSVVFDYRVPYPHNHFDFAIAMNAPTVLYNAVLYILSRY